MSEDEVEGWMDGSWMSWLWVSVPVAAAVLWMRARDLDEVGERGPKETDFIDGREGEGERELRGEEVAVEGGVWITPHCHRCDGLADNHMGQHEEELDLRNPPGYMAEYSSHSRAACFDCHDE